MSVADWLDMCADTVTVEPFTSYSTDGYNTPVYGAALTLRARVEQGPKQIIDAEGRMVVSTVRAYLGSTGLFTVKDRLTLPAGFAPTQPALLKCEPVRDETGLHHTVLYS